MREMAEPSDGSTLLLANKSFDLDERWVKPNLSMEFVNGDTVTEPSSGTIVKRIKLTRSNGFIDNEAPVLLDYSFGPDMIFTDFSSSYTPGYHDIILDTTDPRAIFKPGEDTTYFDLEIISDSAIEGEEWIEIGLQSESHSRNYFNDLPVEPLKLTILDI